MTLYIDEVAVKGKNVRYLKMALNCGEMTSVIVLGWLDSFGNLHVKK